MKAPATYHDSFDAGAEFVDIGLAIPTDKPYFYTLQQDEDEVANPESLAPVEERWAEPARLPDGRKCLRIYVFNEDDMTDDNGERLVPENYPWDEIHIRRIKLIE